VLPPSPCPADADGSLHDACLLAVLAALSSLRLHAVAVDDAGNVTSAAAGGDDRDAQSQRQGTAAAAGNNQPQEQHGRQQPGQQPLTLGCLPVSVTCGVYRGRLLVDPTGEEEPLLEALLTATLDEQGCVLGGRWQVHAQGGRVGGVDGTASAAPGLALQREGAAGACVQCVTCPAPLCGNATRSSISSLPAQD
jgi:exosome complex component RRP43